MQTSFVEKSNNLEYNKVKKKVKKMKEKKLKGIILILLIITLLITNSSKVFATSPGETAENLWQKAANFLKLRF